MWQDSKLARWVHRVTDNSPREWNGIRNDIVDLDRVPQILAKWGLAGNVCNHDELLAARVLLETGLEVRPLNALDRAHAALHPFGTIDD